MNNLENAILTTLLLSHSLNDNYTFDDFVIQYEFDDSIQKCLMKLYMLMLSSKEEDIKQYESEFENLYLSLDENKQEYIKYIYLDIINKRDKEKERMIKL